MRAVDFVIAAAFITAMSGTAMGQTTTTPSVLGDDSNWVASGFIGTNFGTSADNLDLDGGASLDFGGQVAYLWSGTLGAEFIADFAPNVGDANLFFVNEPDVNAYMVNVITAVPFGTNRYFQPYASGGVGAIQMRVDLFDVLGNPFSSNESRFGVNVGGGVMAFADRFGVRADIRYYRATGDDDFEDLLTGDSVIALSNLGFWRGNVGLAIRW
jgi:hypothetical protein